VLEGTTETGVVWFEEAPLLNFLTNVAYFIRIQDLNSEILEGCEMQLSLGACVSMMMTFHNHTDCKFKFYVLHKTHHI